MSVCVCVCGGGSCKLEVVVVGVVLFCRFFPILVKCMYYFLVCVPYRLEVACG